MIFDHNSADAKTTTETIGFDLVKEKKRKKLGIPRNFNLRDIKYIFFND